ncbi:hypothetical protein GOODEAATRI_029186 [Goodea atripinnis]|uniref:Uncharacterized protein n=1 Tax=Goodea atripinnis TaxID=208336 RepID=A0ABV0P8S3_9TELE
MDGFLQVGLRTQAEPARIQLVCSKRFNKHCSGWCLPHLLSQTYLPPRGAARAARRSRAKSRSRYGTGIGTMSRAEQRDEADCVCSVGMKLTWDINDPKLPQVPDP